MNEPTLDDVRAAVFALPHADLVVLALGPLEDEEDCRICEHYDDYVFGYGADVPHRAAIHTLLDWHRWHDDGRGAEGYRRCQVVYALAREALSGAPGTVR